ncbi:hypothetical protein GIB67_013062 [Kingdonia uniflora]|uniref:CCHC-type domain-containing protein n=1 Tax=Kingdonia uniflora TaxID=39325 RepID=A0A7J7MCI8_9MAGN|nr:hypothetical protein GIB67_013062 [Kingdonia uniflora]
MRNLGKHGIHYLQKLNVANVPATLIENGQKRVIDASLTLIRERAKLKVGFRDSFAITDETLTTKVAGFGEDDRQVRERDDRRSRASHMNGLSATHDTHMIVQLVKPRSWFYLPPVDTALRDRQEQRRPVGSPPRHLYVTQYRDDEYNIMTGFERQPQRQGRGSDIKALARALTEQTHVLHQKVLKFDGKSDADAFIDWLDKVEKIFTYKRYGVPKQDYPMITEWSKMRRDMKERFIPMNYNEIIFGKLQSLKVGLSTIDDYTDQFYLLESCARLCETEQQRVSRYKNGLTKKLQEMIALQSVCYLSEIVQLTKQASEFQIIQPRPPVPAQTTISPVIPTVTAPCTYVLGNCYGCGKPGNQKRDCPIFAKKVGLVVDGMRESVIATVQRVLQDEDKDEDVIHTTFVLARNNTCLFNCTEVRHGKVRHGRWEKGELVRALGGAKASASLLGVPLGHNSSFLQGPAFAPPRIREAIWCGSTNATTEIGTSCLILKYRYHCKIGALDVTDKPLVEKVVNHKKKAYGE